MNKIYKIATSIFLILSFNVNANANVSQMKTYDFTSNFIKCVKAKASEGEENTSSGMSVSALMNGKNIVANGVNDNNYWVFMNCLSQTSSPTASHTVESSFSCPGFWFEINHQNIRIRPGVFGKKVNVRGVELICTSNGWGVDDQNDNGDTEPVKDKLPCDKQQVQISACLFDVPVINDGSSTFVESSISSSNDFNGYSFKGETTFHCSNGKLTYDGSEDTVCQKQYCDLNQKVTWSALTSHDNYGEDGEDERATCSGFIKEQGGFVLAEPGEIKYYTTMEEARQKSVVFEGNALFSCGDGYWRLNKENKNSCSKKSQDKLVCKRKQNSDSKLYYCQ